MDRVSVVFEKWDGRTHWRYDAVHLGADEHGLWLGLPVGTHVVRPGVELRTTEPQVVLVPDAAFVATFYAPGGTAPCDTYVDISTVPSVGADVVRSVDLDLDVLRGWSGRVWVDDEDEFADHRETLGYPDEVVELALASCSAVHRAVTTRQAPFDGGTARCWLGALDTAMMAG